MTTPLHGTFPKIYPIWRSHPSLKIKSLQTFNKALQTWSRIKSKGANWCPKQRCECILHHFALPHGLLQGNCEKARSEYIYCKANCILIELQKSWNPPEVPSSINLAASQGSTSPSFLGNKNIPRSTYDPNVTLYLWAAFVHFVSALVRNNNCLDPVAIILANILTYIERFLILDHRAQLIGTASMRCHSGI